MTRKEEIIQVEKNIKEIEINSKDTKNKFKDINKFIIQIKDSINKLDENLETKANKETINDINKNISNETTKLATLLNSMKKELETNLGEKIENKDFLEEKKRIIDSINAITNDMITINSSLKNKADYKHTHPEKMNISGGMFEGVVKAQNNSNFTVAQLRNVILSSEDANLNLMNNGDIWIKYKQED